MRTVVRQLEPADGEQVALLHMLGIPTGFLSSLGQTFLKQIYCAIPSCAAGFGYVCQRQEEPILGFVACAESTGGLYRQALVRRGVPMCVSIIPHVIRQPAAVKRLWETLRYPAHLGGRVAEAEILSLAVSVQARRMGIGRSLMSAALQEFRRRRIFEVKVAVRKDNAAGNAFYKACGFRLVLERLHHGLPMRIYQMALV